MTCQMGQGASRHSQGAFLRHAHRLTGERKTVTGYSASQRRESISALGHGQTRPKSSLVQDTPLPPPPLSPRSGKQNLGVAAAACIIGAEENASTPNDVVTSAWLVVCRQMLFLLANSGKSRFEDFNARLSNVGRISDSVARQGNGFLVPFTWVGAGVGRGGGNDAVESPSV
ncbi:hypothetical protein CDD82_7505 [Ophiocordyceps australis]|uniref:Uncharacterized protein n=1 Tax=Ophiocordyceps australis TaxID=1399860 RepID=A0A2C5YQK8_9HYPO|nr:hypothetical protein CDD82_7505 [Ophiocordyceps australis]